MWQKIQNNWQGLLLATAAGILLTQGLQAQSRPSNAPHRIEDSARPIGQPSRLDIGRAQTTLERIATGTAKSLPQATTRHNSDFNNNSPLIVTEAKPAPAGKVDDVRSAPISAPVVAPTATVPSASMVSATSTASTSTEPLDIAGAERINIKFQGQPELSGDYRVNDDQTISVPVVGRMSIARLDAAALELALADRVSRLTGREAYVTVEVAEYRPVFVSGYVSRPGTAPWKPGLTVLQAITIAGGDFRSSASGGDNFSLRVQRAVDDQKRIFAQVARLEAERAGATKIAIPERLVARVGTQQAKELIDAQNSVFASRRSASDAQIAGLERAIDLTKTEFEGMSSQKKRLAEQLDARRGQLARLKSVYDKGLLRNDRLVDEQIKMADLEEKIASVGVSTARASSTLVGLERELANARQDRNAAIDAELLKLERDVAQLDLEIQSLGVTSSKPILTSTSKDGKDGKDSVIYEIVRQDRTGPRTIVADRYSLLRPGDMVVVSMKQ
ncbi:MAG: hypothetical protein HOO99_11265 [Hyphomicrobiaceae bacterium]|nr:hypothetical protein [Hyphomicrobiaceae bacterium]